MICLRQMLLAASALSLLAGCQPNNSQNQYNYDQLGKSQVTEFATVVAVRKIDIHGQNTGAGAAIGGAAGGITGYQMGNGNGQIATTVAGAAIGAVAGAVSEQALANDKGIEYTLVRENGKTTTIAQPIAKDDRIFIVGERVMIQLSGSYQRVLPADNIPTEIKRPQGIKLID